MRLLILLVFILVSSPVFAEWSKRTTGSGYSSLDDGSGPAKAEAFESMNWYAQRSELPYYYTVDVGLTDSRNKYYAHYRLYQWHGEIPSNLSTPDGELIYNHVYTDEQCQAQYGDYGRQYVDAGIGTDGSGTIDSGACSISLVQDERLECFHTDDGHPRGGFCYGHIDANSTGDVNDPDLNFSESDQTSKHDVPDYLTPVSECNNYNCVTIDGHLYQVDQDAIPDNGSIDISQESDTIQFYKGGGYKLTHPDGSYEIMDGQGNTTYHNADGSIDPNGGSDSGSGSGSDSGSDGGNGSGNDSGSGAGDSGSDGGGDSSGGGTTPGTGDGDSGGSDDGEGDSGDGDGDSTLDDVVGAIYNLRDSVTGSFQEGFDGVVDKLTGTDGMPSEAEATGMVKGQAASDEVMEKLQTQYDEKISGDEGLFEGYKNVYKSEDSKFYDALTSVGHLVTKMLPGVPTGSCSPLVFGDGDASFTISCEVFDMIKAALSWILFFFTAYEVTSISLGYRNN